MMGPQGPAAAAGHTPAAALVGAAVAAQVGAAATAAAAATAHEAGLGESREAAMMDGPLAALAGILGPKMAPLTDHQGPLMRGAGTAAHPRHAPRRAMVAVAGHPCAGGPLGRLLAMMGPGTAPMAPSLASGREGHRVMPAGTGHQALTGTALTRPTAAAATAHAAAAPAEVAAGAGHVTVQHA